MNLQALPHQIAKSKTIIRKLRLYGVALFAGEVRSGKTAAFIIAAQSLVSNDKILVITKKGAIPGVTQFAKDIDVTNYHQAKKVTKIYTLVILDECHRYITGYPKRSSIWKEVAKVTLEAEYVIFSSGTPTPESYAMLFNMLALSPDSPWNNYKSYTKWHSDYGIPYKKKVANGLLVNGWDRVKDTKIWDSIKHLVVQMTRAEAGHKFDAVDKIHKIPLNKYQQELYDDLDVDNMHEIHATDYTILADTTAKMLQKKHQIAGGYVNAVSDLDESITMNFEVGSDKVQYIKDNFDPKETIILAFYIPEQEYLATIFPNVGSITKNSDGVDYSHFKNMVIYSMGFPASTYEQVRGRQLNFIKRKEEVIIHFLISGIDQYVYNAVSNKQSFTAEWYRSNR